MPKPPKMLPPDFDFGNGAPKTLPSDFSFGAAPKQVVPQAILDRIQALNENPTQFEKERPGNSAYLPQFLQNLGGLAQGAVSGVQPGGYPDIQYQPGKGLQETPASLSLKQQAAQQGARAASLRQAGQGQQGFTTPYPAAYRAVAPFVPTAPTMEAAARRGDTNGVNAAWDAPVVAMAAAQAIPVVADAIPSKARASTNLNAAMEKAANVPIDTSTLRQISERADQIAKSGTTLPKLFSDFLSRIHDMSNPVTYAEIRDFAVNAGDLSMTEKAGISKRMYRQIGQFAKEADAAAQAAADVRGVGAEHAAGMSEYAAASRNAARFDLMKKWLTRALPPAAAAYYGAKEFTQGR